ncbi:MAG: MutS-related protein [Chitinophagaceae bacterium]
MLFTTDKQTLEDLNIFGKHGGDSIYNMFNRCATRGGAAALEEMFRYPLSDHNGINRRGGIIRFFSASNLSFPFPNAHFDAIEPYLANQDERTRISHEKRSLTQKMSNMIAPDTETMMVVKGVTALIEIFQGCQVFISSLKLEADHFYATEKRILEDVLKDPVFEALLQHKGKPGLELIAEYDVLLRFRHRDRVQLLLRHIYLLDVYISVAKVAREQGFVFAQALPKDVLSTVVEGVYHPRVPNAVPNSLHISPEGNVLFLTGANMAGKSTFMKSISIAMYLAHVGFPVAATKMAFSVMDGIYTTINLPDNLGMGASHFYAEVLRVKKMAQELSQGKNLFIVFDELFRGTNVKDAYEATIAITKGFARRRNSLFLVSTHIIEAGEVLGKSCSNIRFIYLPTRMNGNKPVYTYTLEKGITDDRHGMIIINNEGILDILEAGLKEKKSA